MISERYENYKRTIENNLEQYLPDIPCESKILKDSMLYSLQAGGKRLRSVILLAAFDLAKKNSCSVIDPMPFAAAAECIQSYSLIHDDLPAMDDDDYRRGKLTNHKVFGEGIAILAGDGLLSAAFEIMSKELCAASDDSSDLKAKANAMFILAKNTGAGGMVAGQVADIKAENGNCSKELINFIHKNKTSAFIEAAVLAGLYLGKADEEMLENGRIYGENLGLAFQIADDLLDIYGDENTIGKPLHSDEDANKSTYPALYGTAESVRIMNELLDKAVKALEKYGSDAELFKEISDYTKNQIKACI